MENRISDILELTRLRDEALFNAKKYQHQIDLMSRELEEALEVIEGPYCHNCGEDEKLKYNEQYANGEYWTCKTCDNNFFYERRKEEW